MEGGQSHQVHAPEVAMQTICCKIDWPPRYPPPRCSVFFGGDIDKDNENVEENRNDNLINGDNYKRPQQQQNSQNNNNNRNSNTTTTATTTPTTANTTTNNINTSNNN